MNEKITHGDIFINKFGGERIFFVQKNIIKKAKTKYPALAFEYVDGQRKTGFINFIEEDFRKRIDFGIWEKAASSV